MKVERALASWIIELRYLRRSPRTIDTYNKAVEGLGTIELDEIDRDFIKHHILSRLGQVSGTTANKEARSLHTFFVWCVAEGLIAVNPMAGLSKPKVEEKPVSVIPPESFARMLKDAEQDRRQNGFLSKRDLAALWLLWDSGMRGGELITIKSDSFDLKDCLVDVHGKTGFRTVPFTSSTGRALDRYLRARATHRYSHLDSLWLSKMGSLTLSGLRRALSERARSAGVDHVYPHQFRHTAADRFLSLGLGEGEVMAIMGWRSRGMLDRYGQSNKARRAIGRYRDLVG